jgi:hypothetical protein
MNNTPSLRNRSWIYPLGLLVLFIVGWFMRSNHREDVVTAPPGSVYYTGKLLVKPKTDMVPSSPSPFVFKNGKVMLR